MAPKRGGKVVSVPAKKKPEKAVNPLFEKRPKQFGIGGALPPKRDMSRFVKWPKIVQIQRKKRILKQRLKVPPALKQFTKTLDKNLATSLFKMLLKCRPEDRAVKKDRLLMKTNAEAEGRDPGASKKPIVVKYGLDHVTYLIEQNKAQPVVIAHDVDPIELVVWLPAVCRKMEIPYCIVKGKARLGTIVHKKTASVLCLTTVKNEDKLEFSKILETPEVKVCTATLCLMLQILSWDFRHPSDDVGNTSIDVFYMEARDDTLPSGKPKFVLVQPGSSWQDLLISSGHVMWLLSLYGSWRSKSSEGYWLDCPMAVAARKLILQLCSLSGTIFASDNSKMQEHHLVQLLS